MVKKLVAYFSATGTTEKRAKELAGALDADIYEIEPVKPYTSEDLNWDDKESRSSIEANDRSSRPEIGVEPLDVSEYDIIYLGFPIWWYIAPRIVKTFLEAHDFSGKTIIVWATSGGSGLGKTVSELEESAPYATFIEGGMANGISAIDQIARKA